MADDKNQEQQGEGESLEGGSYDVIRARLVKHGRELSKRCTQLNELRKETFGGTELVRLGIEKVSTELNCDPCDVVKIGKYTLIAFNVFLGLKSVPKIEHVFSLCTFSPKGEGGGHSYHPASLDAIPGLFDNENFEKLFVELYKYTKGARVLRLKVTPTKLFVVFQIGPDPRRNIRVFHWNIDPGGNGLVFVDNRGERELPQAPSHEVTWTATEREDQRGGLHPHVSIQDRVFVETVGGDLTIKVEDNTADGLGIYREEVEEPDQSLDDARIEYDDIGPLILIRVLPYREEVWRYFVFNERTKEVVRIDAIGQSCQLLPEEHGIVFPGGFYLTSGESTSFAVDIEGLEFEERVDSPNGEDVMYVYHRRDTGRYALLPYNLIRKEVAQPILCRGYCRYDDGKLPVLLDAKEPTTVHQLRLYDTPFVSAKFAAAAPTDDSYLAKVGNAELVKGISEAYSLLRLIENEDPRRITYEDVITSSTHLLNNFDWLKAKEAGELAPVITDIRSTGELIIDEFDKVVAIRKRAREALAEARAQQEALVKTLRVSDFKGVDQYMEGLTKLRSQRGHVITLKDVRAIDLPALDELEKELVEQFERVSKACVDFLVGGDALKPIGAQLDEVLGRVEGSTNALELEPIKVEIEGLGDGLKVLAEVVSGLQVGDAVARTKILEDISEVMAHQGRVRATFQSKRKELLTSEGRAEFAAQFKLFSQSVSSALGMAETPEKCDEQLTALLVQLEELEGRFSEFDEFLGDLAAKREEVHDAFQAKKQTLLDQRQARVQNLLGAAERILSGVARRAQGFKTPDELNAYFAADAMVLKIRELIERLGKLGASVKAEEIASRIKSSKQNALRALRDKTDLFEDGGNLIKFGRHRFSVNTQVVDLTVVRHGEGMAFHLGGTDYFDMITDEGFEASRDYWEQQIVSETEEVYRGEYLAASLLFAADSGEGELTLNKLYDAGRGEGGLLGVVRKHAANRYDEGYERGLHDSDAALILDKLLRMWATAGLLRVASTPRAWACLFWAWSDAKAERKAWHRRAQSVVRLRDALGQSPALEALGEDLAAAISKFLDEHGIAHDSNDVAQAGMYLVEELASERPRFTTSATAQDLVDALMQALDATNKRRAFEDDLRALEGRLGERFALARAWVEAFAARPDAPKGSEHSLVEAAVIIVTDRKLDRDIQSAISATEVTGLLGQHPRIRERTLELRLDEFLSRLGRFTRERVPGFRAYRKLRSKLIEQERERLRLDEFKPKILSSFVRNRLVNEVYLPLVGDNLAKQLGASGASKRTDQMGLLLLISPPGYGKTTLMEYIANRLGLVFMKVNGPALGHNVVSLDPAEAPNATAAEEVKKIGLALEMGNNVMLYLDDIQHTHPELLQKFISLCDATRRIEGVWKGKTRTYDLRGKKFCVIMAGNPYTESGESFQIPDMLSNRADTYNLGDVLGGREEQFALSYIENSLTSNPTLAPLAGREMTDVYKFVKMADGQEVASSEFSHDYSGAEIQEILATLKHLKACQDVLLKVNLLYIQSAAMDDAYRREPPFKLQGSYRNMNKLAEKVVPAMTPAEVEALIDDHYLGEAQTLTTEAEQNTLKLAELRGRLTGEKQERWAHIKKEYVRTKSLGGAEDDPAVRVLGQLSIVAERLESIRSSLDGAAETAARSHKETRAHTAKLTELARFAQQGVAAREAEPKTAIAKVAPPAAPSAMPAWLRPQLIQLTRAMQLLSQPRLQVQVKNEPPPGVTELLAQQVAIVERTLVPLVQSAAEKLGDVRGLEKRVTEILGRMRDLDSFIRQGGRLR